MCEPLKDKVQFANWKNPFFKEKDIKSAVTGAQKELEQIVNDDKVVNPKAFMKKWFSDVYV